MSGPALLLLASSLACGADPPARAAPEVFALESVPDALRPTVEKAEAAMRRLQSMLLDHLARELNSGGIVAALETCSVEAPVLASQVAQEQGVAVGRTSHRLRNRANAPRPWVERFVTEGAGRKYEELRPQVVDLGDRVGLVRPIPMLGMCVKCHGRREEIVPEARDAIRRLYPNDRAVDFSVGELRGWLWAEVPKPKE
jgi:hypothetical protein